MKVLAIDPGYDRLGAAVMSYESGQEVLHFSTCLQTDRNESLAKRLGVIGAAFSELVNKHRPDTVAIETLFFNKNVKTALGVAHARGVVLYLATIHGCTIREFGPQEIKIAVTGYGRSDKNAVTTMVQQLVPAVPPNAHDDEYDAIAIGVTCLAHYGRR